MIWVATYGWTTAHLLARERGVWRTLCGRTGPGRLFTADAALPRCRVCEGAPTPVPHRTVPDAPAATGDPWWQDRAACAGVVADWVPDRATTETYRLARAHCRGCPVRGDCLADGLARLHSRRGHGIYGGYLLGRTGKITPLLREVA